MIKNSTYIRQFTPEQKTQLNEIAQQEGFKNATDVLLYVLSRHQDNVNQLDRLKRFNERKTEKIAELQEQLNNLKK